jgi:hypothetical protein
MIRLFGSLVRLGDGSLEIRSGGDAEVWFYPSLDSEEET